MLENRAGVPKSNQLLEHVAGCERCYEVVSESLLVLDELEAETRVGGITRRPRRSRLVWVAAAAMIILTAGIVGLIATGRTSSPDPMMSLIAAAPEQRRIVARLSGFEHAPLVSAWRGADATRSWKLLAAAARIQEEADRNPTRANLHALGVAHLLLGEIDEAITTLERAQAPGDDPRVRADLAAAYLQRGMERERPADLARAFEISDGLERPSPEALFNRAVAQEWLGPRELAIEAWKRYLEIDQTSAWAVEAQQRLRALEANPGADATTSSPPTTLER